MEIATAGDVLTGGKAASRPLPSPFVWVPALLVSVAVLLPVVYLAVRAAGADREVWGLLLSARTGGLLLNTLLLAAAVAVSASALAIPLAWLTVRTDLPGSRMWSVLTVLPLVIPSYVGGYVVATAFGPGGLLHNVLAGLGVEARIPDVYGFPGAWLTLTLVTYPYVLLSVRAGLRGLDPALEDAARMLGESRARAFRRAVLPQLRPWIGAGALLVALYALADFGAVSMLQFPSFTWAIFVQYQSAFNRSYAAALGLVLVVLAAGLLLLEERRGRAAYHRIGTGVSRRPRLQALGPWRWPAAGFCALVTGLGVGLPAGVLAYWLVAGLRQGEPLVVALRPALNSLTVSALAAGATLLAALPVAITTARVRGRLGIMVGRVAYAAYALPGLVVALALVFFAARYAPLVYQTLTLLLFAYVILFLPQAVGALRAALEQMRPTVEEAARTLGRTPRQVLWSVTLPLVRPGALAAAALVFLTTMKELPATLLLSPIGFETLATRVWSAATEGFFARAAPHALLLVLLSSLSMLLIARQDRSPRP